MRIPSIVLAVLLMLAVSARLGVVLRRVTDDYEADFTVPTASPLATGSTTPTSTASPTDLPGISLIFGGDIMLGRQVEVSMKRYGASWPMAKLAATMKNADITIANLESPFSSTSPSTASGSLVLRGYPEGIVNLTDAGIDLVSLANNHITDMGTDGLTETNTMLDTAGIAHVGAGSTPIEAAKPKIIESNGVKVGFLSYAYGVNIEKAGIHYGKADPVQVKSDVTALKKEVSAVVVLCHCGAEYRAQANATQKTFSHAAVDAGASLVIGHHPHVPQPVEKYRNGVIAYSLGNLVFDQLPGENRDVSALASVTLQGEKVISFSLVPYHIYNYGQPALLESQTEKDKIWGLFALPGGSLAL